jgi:hypothetical protein
LFASAAVVFEGKLFPIGCGNCMFALVNGV